jgi:hypothetical protein
MPRSDLTDQPNPFAFAAMDGFQPVQAGNRGRSNAKTAMIRAAKYFLMIALVFAALLAVRHLSGQWLLNQLTHDFQTLAPDEQQKRLAQIVGFGRPAIPHLVSAMAADETTTGRIAYEMLRKIQNEWTVLSESSSIQHHADLVAAIAVVAPRLPDDRTGWATSLLQQSILESVDQASSEKQYLYRSANDTLAILAHDHRSGPSILGSGDQADRLVDRSPRRLVAKVQPLPVDQTDAGGQWTDWPPKSEDTPSIYRSGSNGSSIRMRPVLASQPIELKPIDSLSRNTSAPPSQPIVQQVQSIATLVETALEVYDDQSVMHFLCSEDGAKRQAAKLELLSRGYNEAQIQFATNLAHPDASVRLHFVNALSQHSGIGGNRDIDPRPWLALMANDESRNVRLAVVSVLGSLSDRDATDLLRQMMSQERDPSVAARIRSVLKLGEQVRR